MHNKYDNPKIIYQSKSFTASDMVDMLVPFLFPDLNIIILPNNYRTQKYNIAGTNLFIHVVTLDYVFKSAEDADKFIDSISPDEEILACYMRTPKE